MGRLNIDIFMSILKIITSTKGFLIFFTFFKKCVLALPSNHVTQIYPSVYGWLAGRFKCRWLSKKILEKIIDAHHRDLGVGRYFLSR